MPKRITINDLAAMIKEGFDTQTKLLTLQGQQISDIGRTLADHGSVLADHGELLAELKEEVFQNGDALAKFIICFEDESSANLTAHERIETRLERMEHKTDLRLNRIEHCLNLTPIPFPVD